MKIQLHSIDHSPASLPYWRSLMDDLCNPPAHRVAQVLGMSDRSIQRYNSTGYAPRVACLVMFWLSSWGRSAVHTQAHNDTLLMVGYVDGLRSEVEQLQDALRGTLNRDPCSIGHLAAVLRRFESG